ncbi:hypothetical protein Fot_28779 [Forsythia ovata]|uniref:Uncharacterized protein n=1 Tax=Forsythia ovata TaxID=205694 RepID=A0ABD1TQF0_9LAMI
MVLEKDKQLVEVMGELKMKNEKLVAVKASVTDVDARAMRLCRSNFPSTPEYNRLATRFMEARCDQLTEKIQTIHPMWDLSFLMSNPIVTPTLESSTTVKAPHSPLVVEDPICRP